MIFDRLDGSKVNLPSQNPAGILREAGLDITMSDNILRIDFEDGGYSMARGYLNAFNDMRSAGVRETQLSGNGSQVVEVAVDPHSYLGNFTHACAAVLGHAIQQGDSLGQRADAILGEKFEALAAATPPAVAGQGGFAVVAPTFEV